MLPHASGRAGGGWRRTTGECDYAGAAVPARMRDSRPARDSTLRGLAQLRGGFRQTMEHVSTRSVGLIQWPTDFPRSVGAVLGGLPGCVKGTDRARGGV